MSVPSGARSLPRRLPSSVLLGALFWAVFVAVVRPGPLDPAWIHALLLLAPLVLVPLGLALAETPGGGGRADRLLVLAGKLQLPAAAVLAAAYLLPQGPLAAVLVLPWVLVAALVAIAGLARLLGRGLRPRWALGVDAGLVYLAVGAAWAVSDRLGYRPLDFAAVIVVLTAVHFHYAGFVLPIVAGHILRRSPGLATRAAVVGVVAGVPLLAAGITATQLGLGPWFETVAAWIVAAAGILVAGLHLRLSFRAEAPAAARILWAAAGLALLGGMALAALYGSRFLVPGVRWLDIAWMQALHGGANTFGFALAALLGWYLALPRASSRQAAASGSGSTEPPQR